MDTEFSDVSSFSLMWHIVVNLFEGEQYVSFSLNLFQQDYYTNGHRQPTLDYKQDWMLSYSKEENGVTTLIFHRKRNTTNQQTDVTIEVSSFMPADP